MKMGSGWKPFNQHNKLLRKQIQESYNHDKSLNLRLQSRETFKNRGGMAKVYMESRFFLVDKLKLFGNAWPTICQRKSLSSSERSLNLRLLKIFQYALKKIFEIAKRLWMNFFSRVHLG